MRQSGGRSVMKKMKDMNDVAKVQLLIRTFAHVLEEHGAVLADGHIDLVNDQGETIIEGISLLELYNDSMKYLDSLKNSTNQENQTNDKPTRYV